MKTKMIITVMLLCGTLSQAAAQDLLQAYIDTALKNNPAYYSYQLKNQAMRQKIEPAKALPDPVLFGGVINLPTDFNFNQDMMTMKQIGIQQSFSVSKKYTLKGSVAQEDLDADGYIVEAQKLSLIENVKQNYYDLYAQTKAIEITEKDLEVIRSYIKIANTRYSTGQGTQQDIFKAQVELSKMQQELINVQSIKEHQVASFNTLLGRNIMDSATVATELAFQKISLNMDSLMLDADKNSPIVLSSKAVLSKDSTSYMLSKTSNIPDFNAGLWYGQRQAIMPDGDKAQDMLGLTFGMTLPIYSRHKQDPLIAGSGIQVEKSQSDVKVTQDEVRLMLHHGIITANENEKLVALYGNLLIPQATESLDAGITGYQENKIDFMTLIDNFLSLYDYQIKYYQSVADYYKAIAEIEMVTGRTLTMH